jgi:isopenicillin N synthase-like dioxygenase
MLTPPLLRSDQLGPAEIDEALLRWRGFLLEPREGELPWRAALAAADELFALPRDAKRSLAMERSPHFRGWSEMHNERDWREQIHLGRESPPAGTWPPFLRLEGPNLEPPDPAWRAAVRAYMDAAAHLGETILCRVAQALGLPPDGFENLGRDGYLLLKMIHYHPRARDAAPRSGVAAHVDFSWLTLTLESRHGLSVRRPNGTWFAVEPPEGCLWVHVGELLQFATDGHYQAAPHRVVNRAIDRSRVSIPLFLNPPLDDEVRVLARARIPAASERSSEMSESEHVHRVLVPESMAKPFHFGAAEWRRKGLGGWCATCAPPSWRPSAP